MRAPAVSARTRTDILSADTRQQPSVIKGPTCGDDTARTRAVWGRTRVSIKNRPLSLGDARDRPHDISEEDLPTVEKYRQTLAIGCAYPGVESGRLKRIPGPDGAGARVGVAAGDISWIGGDTYRTVCFVSSTPRERSFDHEEGMFSWSYWHRFSAVRWNGNITPRPSPRATRSVSP